MVSVLFLFLFLNTSGAEESVCKNGLALIHDITHNILTTDISKVLDYDILKSRIQTQKDTLKDNSKIDYSFFLKSSEHYKNLYSHYLKLNTDATKIQTLMDKYRDDNCEENNFSNILDAVGTQRSIFYFGLKVRDLRKTLERQSLELSQTLTEEQVLSLLPQKSLPTSY